jgi:hypothetical protein
METHTSMLAFESALVLALMALSSAAVWLLLWWRSRVFYMLLLLVGWLGLCFYWLLLAILVGFASVVDRTDVMVAVRVLGIVVALVIAAGKLCMLARMFRNGKNST